MKQDKELFHQISSSLEDNLLKIQNAHPINAGAMIRNRLPSRPAWGSVG